jgi:hypothetical protein
VIAYAGWKREYWRKMRTYILDVGLVAINVQPPLSKKEATMVGCWWQPTTIV